MLRRATALVGLLGLAAIGVVACGARQPPASGPGAAPGGSDAGVSSSSSATSGQPAAQMVNAMILANGCKVAGAANARLAEKAMNQLTEGCTSVPGGKAEFQATLQPGGRIAINAVPGQPDVVPICVLKHALQHSVPLTQPCRLDVKLEQISVMVSRDGGA
jgi:hypothetical protein